MSWPVLVVLRVGRLVWIPIPFLLLWPLLGTLWLAGLARHLVRAGSRLHRLMGVLGAIPGLCASVRGTRVTVEPAEGPGVRVVVV